MRRLLRAPFVVLWCAVASAMACRKDGERLPTEPRSLDDVFGHIESRWVGAQATYSYSQPAVVGNVVIAASGDQKLTARNRMTGAILWSTVVTSVNAEPRIWGRNLVARSGVVVAAVSRNTVGVEVATGQELWSYGAPTDSLVDPPTKPATVELVHLDADDSTAYIPAWGASVSAIDLRSGAVRWVWRPAPGTPYRSGAAGVRVSGDTVFASVWHYLGPTNTSSEGWVVSIDRKTGQELGRATIPPYTFGNVFNGRPIVWKHLVIVAGPAGRVWAVNRSTNQIAWQYAPTAGGGNLGGPALGGDVVYADGGDGYAVALKAIDGAIVWRTKTLGQTDTDVHVSDTRVYVSTGGFLNIIDRFTGLYVARTQQPPILPDGGLFASQVAAADQRVYVIVNGGVWCFDEP